MSAESRLLGWRIPASERRLGKAARIRHDAERDLENELHDMLHTFEHAWWELLEAVLDWWFLPEEGRPWHEAEALDDGGES